jgi:hypothetical protein
MRRKKKCPHKYSRAHRVDPARWPMASDDHYVWRCIDCCVEQPLTIADRQMYALGLRDGANDARAVLRKALGILP